MRWIGTSRSGLQTMPGTAQCGVVQPGFLFRNFSDTGLTLFVVSQRRSTTNVRTVADNSLAIIDG